MAARENKTFEVLCPCCGARLTIDAFLAKVITFEPPPRASKELDFDHIGQLLDKEKERREAMFKQSAEEEKVKSQLLERKFEERLKKTKDEPVTRPTRDIDLD